MLFAIHSFSELSKPTTNMKVELDLQIAEDLANNYSDKDSFNYPSLKQMQAWINIVLLTDAKLNNKSLAEYIELTIRLVTKNEIQN